MADEDAHTHSPITAESDYELINLEDDSSAGETISVLADSDCESVASTDIDMLETMSRSINSSDVDDDDVGKDSEATIRSPQAPVEVQTQHQPSKDDAEQRPSAVSTAKLHIRSLVDATLSTPFVKECSAALKVRMQSLSSLTKSNMSLAKWALPTAIGMLLLLLGTTGILNFDLPPATDAAAKELHLRTIALDVALKNQMAELPFFASVKACDILRYPNATMFVSGVPDTTVTFPTSVSVFVARPDQLFVTFPKRFKSFASADPVVDVHKNGQRLANVNCTSLIAGVIHMALDPADAHGYVDVQYTLTDMTHVSEAVTVDLGSRFFQRYTYQKAANRFKKPIEEFLGGNVSTTTLQSAITERLSHLSNHSSKTLDVWAGSVRTARLWTMDKTQGAISSVAQSYRELISSDGDSMEQEAVKVAQGWVCIARARATAIFVKARNNAVGIHTRLSTKANKLTADVRHGVFDVIKRKRDRINGVAGNRWSMTDRLRQAMTARSTLSEVYFKSVSKIRRAVSKQGHVRPSKANTFDKKGDRKHA